MGGGGGESFVLRRELGLSSSLKLHSVGSSGKGVQAEIASNVAQVSNV
jgi:hypothetical protein